MKLPTIGKWSAGDQPDASLFNQVSYALDFAMNPPKAWVVKTGTAQTIPINAWTAVNLSAIVIDTGALKGDSPVWTAANPTKLFPQTPGWYEITGNVEWTSSTDSTRRILGIQHTAVDGVTKIRSRIDVLTRGVMKQRTTLTWFINVGESIEMMVNSGAATSLGADPTQNSLRSGLRIRWFSL